MFWLLQLPYFCYLVTWSSALHLLASPLNTERMNQAATVKKLSETPTSLQKINNSSARLKDTKATN